MYALLLTAALAASPSQVVSCTSPDEAAVVLAGEVQTGTLLFSKGDCLAVRVFTASPYTHVATVVMDDGRPYVYDSQNGVGVRRLTLDEYCRVQSPERLHVYSPRQPFDERRTERFVACLDKELGRPYSVAHHLTGRRSDGLHCAEYVTDALMACRLIHAHNPPRVSPASLRQGLIEGDLYAEVATVEIHTPEPPPKQGSNWCSQLWIDTCVCTKTCCRRMRGWFLCK